MFLKHTAPLRRRVSDEFACVRGLAPVQVQSCQKLLGEVGCSPAAAKNGLLGTQAVSFSRKFAPNAQLNFDQHS